MFVPLPRGTDVGPALLQAATGPFRTRRAFLALDEQRGAIDGGAGPVLLLARLDSSAEPLADHVGAGDDLSGLASTKRLLVDGTDEIRVEPQADLNRLLLLGCAGHARMLHQGFHGGQITAMPRDRQTD
jgi:hypothetical protein